MVTNLPWRLYRLGSDTKENTRTSDVWTAMLAWEEGNANPEMRESTLHPLLFPFNFKQECIGKGKGKERTGVCIFHPHLHPFLHFFLLGSRELELLFPLFFLPVATSTDHGMHRIALLLPLETKFITAYPSGNLG